MAPSAPLLNPETQFTTFGIDSLDDILDHPALVKDAADCLRADWTKTLQTLFELTAAALEAMRRVAHEAAAAIVRAIDNTIDSVKKACQDFFDWLGSVLAPALIPTP